MPLPRLSSFHGGRLSPSQSRSKCKKCIRRNAWTSSSDFVVTQFVSLVFFVSLLDTPSRPTVTEQDGSEGTGANDGGKGLTWRPQRICFSAFVTESSAFLQTSLTLRRKRHRGVRRMYIPSLPSRWEIHLSLTRRVPLNAQDAHTRCMRADNSPKTHKYRIRSRRTDQDALMLSDSRRVHESSGLGKSSDGLSSISFDKLFQRLLLFFFSFFYFYFIFSPLQPTPKII